MIQLEKFADAKTWIDQKDDGNLDTLNKIETFK